MFGENKEWVKQQLIWMGIAIAVSLTLSILLPIYIALPLIIASFLVIIWYARKVAARRFGMLGYPSASSVNYHCLSCGTKHALELCPSCGSKMKKADF